MKRCKWGMVFVVGMIICLIPDNIIRGEDTEFENRIVQNATNNSPNGDQNGSNNQQDKSNTDNSDTNYDNCKLTDMIKNLESWQTDCGLMYYYLSKNNLLTNELVKPFGKAQKTVCRKWWPSPKTILVNVTVSEVDPFSDNEHVFYYDDKTEAVKVANRYFKCIKDLCPPIEEEYIDKHRSHIDTVFIKWVKNSPGTTSNNDLSLNPKIDVKTIEDDTNDDNFNKVIENNVNNLKNALKNGNDWQHNSLANAKTVNDARKKALRNWYCKYPENFPQDAYYKPVNGELQQYVFKNFITLPNQKYGSEEAKLFLNMLKEDFGVCSINNEDCEKRPWYVIGTFFDFISVGRFYKIESQNKDDLPLAKYLPKSAGEIGWKRELLAEDYYRKSLDTSLKRWLELKFAYTKDQLDQLDTTQKLLDEIRSNLVKTKPYYRFLKQKKFPQPSESTNNSEELFLQSMVDMKHR